MNHTDTIIEEYLDSHHRLMQQWRSQYETAKCFIEDGIVNPKEWFGLPKKERIVFLLKEAYTRETNPSDWNEAKWLNGSPCRDDCQYKNCSERCRIKGYTFNRIAEWIYCITELPKECIPVNIHLKELLDQVSWLGVYDKNKSKNKNKKDYHEKRAMLLKKASIVNLKKADGEKCSHRNSMKENVMKYGDMLLKQIELIQPNYVICCGTWRFLNERIQIELKEKYNTIIVPHPNAHISRSKALEPVLKCLNSETEKI